MAPTILILTTTKEHLGSRTVVVLAGTGRMNGYSNPTMVNTMIRAPMVRMGPEMAIRIERCTIATEATIAEDVNMT